MAQNKALNVIKKIFGGIVWGVFGIVFFVTLWLFADKFIFKSPVPSFFGYSSLTIQTGSMSGTMEIGDMIIIKDTGDYKIGDIITFLPDGAKIPTTHRIINYADNGEFVTKGDANNVQDTNNITKDKILGEVIAHLPNAGQFTSWVQKEGWIYIVSILVIIILGAFILKSTTHDVSENSTQKISDNPQSQPQQPPQETKQNSQKNNDKNNCD